MLTDFIKRKQADTMKKLTFIVPVLCCILGCTEINQTENLMARVDTLQTQNDSLTSLLTEKRAEVNYWYEGEYDGVELINQGIQNPSAYIETNFRKQTDLIPIEAILGGPMSFNRVQLLSSEWLIADFSDGHIQGRAIYKYELGKNGQLKFELLCSMEPE
jgi:hypothetical protein